MEFDSKILKYLKLDKLIENLIGYGETKIALVRLELEEKLEEFTKNALHFGLLAIFAMLFLIFVSFAICQYLNTVFESNYLGYVVVSSFYFILALILIFDKDKKLVNSFLKKKDEDA